MKSCAICDGKRTSGIHSAHHPNYHPYQDATRPGLQPMSEGMRNYRETSGYNAEKERARGAPCQIVSPVCTGTAEDLHEPLPRGRAGGLAAAVEVGGTIPACRSCNAYVSGEGQVWAAERGFLFKGSPAGMAAARAAKVAREAPAPKKRSKSLL